MSEERDDTDVRTTEAWVIGLAGGAVILILLLTAYLIGFNAGEREVESAGPAEEPVQKQEPAGQADDPAKALFVEACGSCHALEAAGTSGGIGPDLDQLGVDEEQTLAAIENGGAGSGQMPAGLLSGKDAELVAAYVAGADSG